MNGVNQQNIFYVLSVCYEAILYMPCVWCSLCLEHPSSSSFLVTAYLLIKIQPREPIFQKEAFLASLAGGWGGVPGESWLYLCSKSGCE